MKKIVMSLMAVVMVTFSGCSGSMNGGSVAEEDLNKIMNCTRDTRFGQSKMSYNTSTMKNIRQGFGDAEAQTLDLVTIDGFPMHLKASDGWVCVKEN